MGHMEAVWCWCCGPVLLFPEASPARQISELSPQSQSHANFFQQSVFIVPFLSYSSVGSIHI